MNQEMFNPSFDELNEELNKIDKKSRKMQKRKERDRKRNKEFRQKKKALKKSCKGQQTYQNSTEKESSVVPLDPNAVKIETESASGKYTDVEFSSHSLDSKTYGQSESMSVVQNSEEKSWNGDAFKNEMVTSNPRMRRINPKKKHLGKIPKQGKPETFKVGCPYFP